MDNILKIKYCNKIFFIKPVQDDSCDCLNCFLKNLGVPCFEIFIKNDKAFNGLTCKKDIKFENVTRYVMLTKILKANF